jgi:hypothetical protein
MEQRQIDVPKPARDFVQFIEQERVAGDVHAKRRPADGFEFQHAAHDFRHDQIRQRRPVAAGHRRDPQPQVALFDVNTGPRLDGSGIAEPSLLQSLRRPWIGNDWNRLIQIAFGHLVEVIAMKVRQHD